MPPRLFQLHAPHESRPPTRQAGHEGSRWHAGVFASGSTSIRLSDNWIHDNGDPADAGQVNSSHGIYMSSGSGTIISNLVEHNLAYGVHLYNGTGGPHDVLISENTIVDNGRAGVILANDTRNSLVVDNIIAFNGTLAIYGWNLTNTTNRASNNVEFGNRSGGDQNYLGVGGIAFSGEIAADPRFVAPIAGATGGDRRRPAATGGDRRRPAATGGDRRRPAATTASRRRARRSTADATPTATWTT